MVIAASDIITVDAGGKLFKTTTNTLVSSGARFFLALLGQTGAALMGDDMTTMTSVVTPGAKRARSSEEEAENQKQESRSTESIFIDRDPDIFADVLYFMRCNCLSPKTAADPLRLEMLKIESEFFIYDALSDACTKQLQALQSMAEKSLETDSSEAYSSNVIVTCEEGAYISISEGQVLYIVSATLAGECRVSRYSGYPKEPEEGEKWEHDIPGCYIRTKEKEHSGDFQLFYRFDDLSSEKCCIAHVGLDQIHCGHSPMNVDFRQDTRTCISCPDDSSEIYLSAAGAGTWHVHYWAGPPHQIPQLGMMKEKPDAKRRKLLATSTRARNVEKSLEDRVNNSVLLATMLTALATTMLLR